MNIGRENNFDSMIFFQIYRINCRSTCIAKAINSCKAVKWFIPITRILSFDFQHMEAMVTVLGIDCPTTYIHIEKLRN